ncbi:Early growth response protein 1 [Eumeta japonica]|uniref:Early growth response protein 1 n=1 Tax=Eumeta variegata TaxID=151549 RepID=A0A4C1TAK2_EUMVA|nr:Early growth response protein 1 [Eumeta japonica]
MQCIGTAVDGKGEDNKTGGIKVVQLSSLQKPSNNEHDDSDEKGGQKPHPMDDDEETDSSGSMSDSAANDSVEGRPHVCDICDLRFQRSSHLSRHKLTHTGERPFTCGGCGRSFARSDKLRVHTKICEREDPTVDINESPSAKKENNTSEVMSGMVRTTHRESGHLVFTPSGDVMLPPRTPGAQADVRGDVTGDMLPRRGRGRPRKTPLPLLPKIKKRRGRPPKTSLDMEGCVLTSGSVMGPSPSLTPLSAAAAQQLLLKRKRGRPPKNYYMGRADGRPNENYNATNLPFGDFSYLTEMMAYNPMAYGYGVTSVDPDRNVDPADAAETSHDRTIDLSDSSSDEDDSRVEPEENVPPVACETQIMTVGDCQIVKLPSVGEDKGEPIENDQKAQPKDGAAPASNPGSVTITPITTVGDCTIRPVDGAT